MQDLFANLNDLNTYLLFFLVLLRVGGFFQTVPIFGSAAVPQSVKIFFSLVLAIFAVVYLGLPKLEIPHFTWLGFGVLGVKEVMFGVLIGLGLRIVFFAILYGMDLVSAMTGLSYASLFDPLEGQNSMILGSFVEVLALLFFLSLNLHHQVLELLFNSLTWVTPVTMNFPKLSYLAVTGFLSQIFLLGLSFSMPLVVSSLLVNISLGFLNRSIPQFNVFLVGTALVVLLSLGILALELPIFFQAFVGQWTHNLNELSVVLKNLR